MKDHRRILGSLFIAWAIAQAMTTVVLVIFRFEELRSGVGPVPPLFWAVTVALVAAFAWVGARLRAHDTRIQVQVLGLILSVFALFSFPIGTALGIYGLWTLVRTREARTV